MTATACLSSRLPAQLFAVTALLLAVPGRDADAILGGLAIAAALTARHERRLRSLQLAAAIAAALTPLGLALLPSVLGASLGARGLRTLPSAAITGAAAWYLVEGQSRGDTLATLYDVAVTIPPSFALIVASGAALAAWSAADAVARPFAATPMALVGLALFVPLHPLALLAPAVLLVGLPGPPRFRTRAANDDAKPIPGWRLAA